MVLSLKNLFGRRLSIVSAIVALLLSALGVHAAGIVTQAGPKQFASSSSSSSSSGGFTPLQHFSFDAMTTGAAASSGSELSTTVDSNGSNTGSIVSTANPRPGKTKHARARIQSGTSGFPGDGETPAANGFWGWSVNPPASRGSLKFGKSGDFFHVGMWIYIPSGQSLTTNITDGALKFLLNAWPIAVTTGKDDFHICGIAGFAFINEFDPNAGTNNTYPSTRTGTDVGYTPDTWFWLERGTKLDSSGDTAINRLWINNVLILERNGRALKWRHTDTTYGTTTLGVTGSPTAPDGTTPMDFFYILSYWNAHPSTNIQVDFDDITTWVGSDESTLPATDSFGNRMMGMGVYP